MPLTHEQQLLIHALHDGQCTPAELAGAQALAQSTDGAAYLRDLAALGALVREHGKSRAPVGLKGRVLAALDEDFDDISRPTDSIMPMRRIFMLAAACLALTLGVYVAIGAFTPPTTATPEMAKAIEPKLIDGFRAPVVDHTHQPAGSGTDPLARKEAQTPPIPEGNVVEKTGDQDIKESGKNWDGATLTVLNMDRGRNDEQLSIELNRGAEVNALQTYTELLSVACLYADARLIDSRPTDSEASNDFTAYDALEVELPEDAVPAMLSAMRKLTQDQQLGAVQVPQDLQRTVDDTDRLVRELADARDSAREDNANNSEHRIQDYLPPAVLAENLKRSNDMGKTGTKPGAGGGEGRLQRTERQADQRKVKLLIRLQ